MVSSSVGQTSRFTLLFGRALIFLIILLAGMTNLPFPFSGDQALFTIGARALSRGAVLYRDFWDLKQPGIYWFFHVAGALFGYTEIGVHIAELLWFLALAILISVSMSKRFGMRWMSDITALLTVFVYFAVCGTSHLTQLEGLVSLPLFLSLLMVMPSTANNPPGQGRLIAFGMLGSVVALFKLLLVAIPIAFFFVAIFPDRKRNLFRSGAFATLGAAGVLLPVIIYFGMQHQLSLVYRTFFIIPAKIAAGGNMSTLNVLHGSVHWFIKAAALLLPFGLVGAFRAIKKPDRFLVSILVWVFLAAALVLVQRLWWEYHFLLLLFPLGFLAAYGLEETLGQVVKRPGSARRFAAVALVGLVLMPYALRVIRKSFHEHRSVNRQRFQEAESPPFADAVGDARWLASQPPGDIYVLGNPLIYYLSGRRQPIALNGWTPERFLPEQWDELVQELKTSQPRYIFIDTMNDDLLATTGADLRKFLAEQFEPVSRQPQGTWYQRR